MKISELVFIVLIVCKIGDAFNLEVRGNSMNVINFTQAFHADSSPTKATYAGYSLIASAEGNLLSVTAGAPKLSGTDNQGTQDDGGVIQCTAQTLPAAATNVNASVSQSGTTRLSDYNCSIVLHKDNVTAGTNHIKSDDSTGMTMISLGSKQRLVCSPGRKKECGKTLMFVPGACYTGVPGGSMQLVTGWGETPCFKNYLDVMLVVDSSNSISASDFAIMKNIIIQSSNAFASSFGYGTQVGVLQYGDLDSSTHDYQNEANYRYPAKLGQFSTIKDFQNAIKINMNHMTAANTYTSFGIERAVRPNKATIKINIKRQTFTLQFDFNSSINKAISKKVLVLITDGLSSFYHGLIGSYRLTQQEKITVYAIGVGIKDLHELRVSANGDSPPGNNERVLTVDNFSTLNKVFGDLTAQIARAGGEGQTNSGATLSVMENAVLGISANYNHKGGKMLIGAVGSYDGMGTIIKYDSVTDTTANVPNRTELAKIFPTSGSDSYLGYSISSGNFDGGSKLFVAGGAPRHILEGLVAIYEAQDGSSSLTNLQIIKAYHCTSCTNNHRQLGSYFGATLLSADINNDGKDDLLIGAPLFIGDNYDEGRVFVYLSQPSNSAQTWANPTFQPKVFSGLRELGGRFGSVISSAGDLNDDGYNDVIIGAPLAENGAGVIYVYHGHADFSTTASLQYSQRIPGSVMKLPQLNNFGSAMACGQDLDGNSYPDVVVGAPTKNMAFVIRSRPIARFTSSVTLNPQQLDAFYCFKQPNRKCFNVTACISVNGKSVENVVETEVMISLDATRKRIEFRSQDNSTIGFSTRTKKLSLTRNLTTCWTYDVYVKKNILDFSSLISVDMNYSLSSNHTATPMSSMQDPALSNRTSSTAKFNTTCGGDNFCSYNLTIDATIKLPVHSSSGVVLMNASDLLIIDETTDTQPIVISVNISNIGEMALGAKINITFSSSLKWNEIANQRSSNNQTSCIDSIRPEVHLVDNSKIQTLNYIYDEYYGNIMPTNQWCSFDVHLLPSNLKLSGSIPTIHANLHVYGLNSDSGNESHPISNTFNFSREVRYRTDVSVFRRHSVYSTTKVFKFTNSTNTIHSVYQIGENISTVLVDYELSSHYSTIPESSFVFRFPSNISEELNLLYLYQLACTSTQGKATCSCDMQAVNRYNLSTSTSLINTASKPKVTLIPNPGHLTQQTYNCSGKMEKQPAYCQEVRCSVKNLAAGERINFLANFRLWTHSFNLKNANVSFVTGFSFTSKQSALIINKDGIPHQDIHNETIITAKLFEAEVITPQPDLSLIIGLSVGGAVLLLGVIVVILYKCDFFKSEYSEMLKELEWNESNLAEDRQQNSYIQTNEKASNI